MIPQFMHSFHTWVLLNIESKGLITLGMSSLECDAERTPKYDYDRSNSTRKLCLVLLGVSYIFGLVLILFGAFGAKGTSSTLDISGNIKEVISLVINGVIFACTETLGLIHAISLRWALFREGKLDFNANLRMFAFSKEHTPNGRLATVAFLLSIALCYASSPLIFVAEVRDDGVSLYEVYHISKVGPICLGIAILIQCAICTWSLKGSSSSSARIPTWSTNPLVTLAVALEQGSDCNGASENAILTQPTERSEEARKPNILQPSANKVNRKVRRVLIATGVGMLAITIWAIIVTKIAYSSIEQNGTNWSFLPSTPDPFGNEQAKDPSAFNPYVYLYFFAANEEDLTEVELLYTLLFTLAIQSFLTVGLHCAELQVTLLRDEHIWRTIASPTGSDPNLSTMKSAFKSWLNLLLGAFKITIHWMYGMAMFVNYGGGIFMLAPQLVYLCILWLLFLVFLYFITRKRPVGYLPATYGHIKSMMEIVDEWHPRMFWGDKGVNEHGIRHAGTSDHRLLPLQANALYTGLGPCVWKEMGRQGSE